MTAGYDPLADEGMAYARKLEDNGVPVTLVHMSDQMHGFLTMGRVIRASEFALEMAGMALARAFNSKQPAAQHRTLKALRSGDWPCLLTELTLKFHADTPSPVLPSYFAGWRASQGAWKHIMTTSAPQCRAVRRSQSTACSRRFPKSTQSRSQLFLS